jgi:hypothetical protein
MRITSDWVNASHSIGAPFGVIGAGFAWYDPDFITPSPMLTDAFRRYYTLRFDSAQSVLAYAMSRFGE